MEETLIWVTQERVFEETLKANNYIYLQCVLLSYLVNTDEKIHLLQC